MSKCEICGGSGYHKLSCGNNTARVAIPMDIVRLMKQRRCKNHVWRKHYLNGGKVCQVCGKAREEVERNKDVEE
jgi:hypothetical protein